MMASRLLFLALAVPLAASACKRTPPAPDHTAAIEACAAIVEKSGRERTEALREPSRGGAAAVTQITGGAIARTCAPLYSVAACRTAHEHFDDSAVPERIHALVDGCRDAYCPLLAAPKPALCARPPANITEMSAMWDELNEAILRRDLGRGAERVIGARHAAAESINAVAR